MGEAYIAAMRMSLELELLWPLRAKMEYTEDGDDNTLVVLRKVP